MPKIIFLLSLMLSTWLSAQGQGENSLEWIDIDDLGIVSKRKGWFRLEHQDCTRPRNREAGDAKRICGQNPSAKYVQEYLLKFSYLPDRADTKFPFGVPLEFQLRIDKIQEAELYSWQVALSNRSEESTISFYQKKLSTQDLRKLQKEQEKEAFRFLKRYFTCLRQNQKCE